MNGKSRITVGCRNKFRVIKVPYKQSQATGNLFISLYSFHMWIRWNRTLKLILNNISLCLTLLTFDGCEVSYGQGSFGNYCSHYLKISTPITISDSTEFNNWPPEKLIDSSFIIEYGLVDKYLKNEYHIKSLKGYHCSFWGKFEMDNIIILIYKTFTTEAGRGNPQLIMTTYSQEGVKKDETIVLWNDPEDPLYSKRVTLSIKNTSRFEIKSIERTNGYLNGKIVPKRINERLQEYSILANGKIRLNDDKSNLLFLDKDPAIQDYFPSH